MTKNAERRLKVQGFVIQNS